MAVHSAKILTASLLPLTVVAGSSRDGGGPVIRSLVAALGMLSVPSSLLRSWRRDDRLTVSPIRAYDRRSGLPIFAARTSPVWMPIPWARALYPCRSRSLLTGWGVFLIS